MSYLDDIGKVLGKDDKSDTTDNSEKPKPKKLVLIVEDEAVLREMYRDKLVQEGYEVATASNGKQGLEMATANTPHIILLDLMMPVMDGKEMLRKLREIAKLKKLPVIILSNAGDVDNIKETIRYNDASEFLIKSNVTPDDVVRKVKTWI